MTIIAITLAILILFCITTIGFLLPSVVIIQVSASDGSLKDETAKSALWILCAIQLCNTFAYCVGALFAARRRGYVGFYLRAAYEGLLALAQLAVGALSVYVLATAWPHLETLILVFQCAKSPLQH